jgi:hypothetical protein
MKLESFNGKKFEALQDNAMSFIVGGLNLASGPDENGSNDYITSDGAHHHSSNSAYGLDWTMSVMKQFCGENYADPLYVPDGEPVPDPTPADAIWAEWNSFHFVVVP